MSIIPVGSCIIETDHLILSPLPNPHALFEGYIFNWAIYRETEKVGGIGLGQVDIKKCSGEIGYYIHPEYRRQGYATEALGFCLHYLFYTAGFWEITARCHQSNHASTQLLERAGFHLVASLREEDGYDIFLYSRGRDQDLYA